MEKRMAVAHQLKIAANKTTRLAEASIPAEVRRDVTPVQSHIVGFLYHNRDRALYQRDVEAEFSISRATASKLLTAMERGGLIRRSAVAGDARLKRLELTDKALAHMEQIRQGLSRLESCVTQGMTAEERETLIRLLQKVENNAEAAWRLTRTGKEKPL
ncbi:MarR family winged helix-turn-helix transcriptional regulator [Dysosmobacter sp.]|uniref:MarR family winged helix-turn-helix transcriptional regulator n=1 Tax=Dysosmobacter sp. TaxID=2591382 RepID=UPI002A85EC9C|nr:MarR family transcriptional regulator [Dysosmobacter sp.]MDY3282738.1 MarR family transcriptional regulator [Dysosmobacter sp.]